MSNMEKIEGAISLIAEMKDDNNIDNLICHAIKSGMDIEKYDRECANQTEMFA